MQMLILMLAFGMFAGFFFREVLISFQKLFSDIITLQRRPPK
jgi:hypothetical protein